MKKEKHIKEDILYTQDKVQIAYEHISRGSDSIIIICPGFFNSKKNRWMRRVADAVSSEYDTIIFDFRGHGDSGGKFSWAAKEYLDLEAILNYVKKRGYKKIGILAFSLGAAASTIVAGKRNDIDSVYLQTFLDTSALFRFAA
jgi:alpha/beta superfamily hydrolase